MTCIIGLKRNGEVYIGGDALGSDLKFNCDTRQDPKVFRNGNFIMGYTSSFRMGQILEHDFSAPQHPENMHVMKYMVSLFIPAVIHCFDNLGYGQKDTSGQKSGGVFLVGYRNELFEIEGDYQVSRSIADIHACGCGQAYAKGALNGILESSKKYNPIEAIEDALEITSRYSAGVRAPFTVLKL